MRVLRHHVDTLNGVIKLCVVSFHIFPDILVKVLVVSNTRQSSVLLTDYSVYITVAILCDLIELVSLFLEHLRHVDLGVLNYFAHNYVERICFYNVTIVTFHRSPFPAPGSPN